MKERVVDIRQLKAFAVRYLPSDWVLKDIIIAENDEIKLADFLARLPIYLRLSSLGGAKRKY